MRGRCPGFGWSMLGALLAILLGLVLVARPLAGVLTLTMVLVAFFILEGITAIVVAVQHRDHLTSWGWVMFRGIIDLFLAYLILQGLTSAALLVIDHVVW